MREGMYYASKLGMNNGDYAFIAFELDPVLVQRYVERPSKWFHGLFPATNQFSAEEEKEFYKSYKSVLVMVFNVQRIGQYNNFTDKMKQRMSKPPFCSDAYVGYTKIGNYNISKFKRAVSLFLSSSVTYKVGAYPSFEATRGISTPPWMG